MVIEMDPAQAYVSAAMRNQDAMNAVIDRFDSPVQQFYYDTTLFLTGGSGFLGKQFIEKIFRSCKIKKIFVLIRSKKGKSIQERLAAILNDTVYDGLREKQPDFSGKIVPVEGDIREKNLGMNEGDRKTIIEEVDIIVHMAATTRFDEPIRVATLVNVRGTMEIIALAKECVKLKKFIYVSTAYSQATEGRRDKDVLEQFYPCPMPPAALVQMAESMEEDRLNSITPSLIKNWANTYTFTKAVAEETVRTVGADLPSCIVRPSIVLCSYREPVPCWLDMSTLFGPSGVVFGTILGVLRVFQVDLSKNLSFVPVDYVNNAVIAAGWDSAQKGSIQKMDSSQKEDSAQKKWGEKEIPIYNMASIDSCLTWTFLHDVITSLRYKISTPKAVWFCFLIETPSPLVFYLLSWILHLIPAYIVDGVDYVLKLKPKKIPPFVSIYEKVHKMAQVFDFFLSNEWHFRDVNTVAMMSRMTDPDKAIFNCDISSVDRKTFVELWVVGVRKYLIKDGLKDSLKGVNKQKKLAYVNAVVLLAYIAMLTFFVYGFVRLFLGMCCNICIY